MAVFTLPDLIDEAVRCWPDRPAVETAEGSVVTYREFAGCVDRMVRWLASAGGVRRDRGGILLPRSIEKLALIFAINRLGAVFVTLNPRTTRLSAGQVAGDCGLKLLCTDRNWPDWSACPLVAPGAPLDAVVPGAALSPSIAGGCRRERPIGPGSGCRAVHLRFHRAAEGGDVDASEFS